MAGYVNGTVKNVGVYGNATVSISATTPLPYTDNMSDFSLIGYCTDNYKNQNTTLTTDGSLNDNNAGSGSGGSGGTGGSGGSSWGDSLSMGDLHTRIINVYNAVGRRNVPPSAYVETETRTYTGDDTFTREFTCSNTYKQATLA